MRDQFVVRLTSKEKEALRQQAMAAGVSMADYARTAIRERVLTEVPRAPSQRWTCEDQTCLTGNLLPATSCRRCGKGKDVPLAPPPQRWTCEDQTCLTGNLLPSTSCRRCGKEKTSSHTHTDFIAL